MLTKQHQFATRLTLPRQRAAYRTHMCGLCHALGDQYGLPYRLLTNYEMVLLNLLTSVQRQDAVEIVTRRCPLNPMLKVSTNQDVASEFAAAVAVELAKISIEDDLQDSGGRDFLAQVASWTLGKPHRLALCRLNELGFETETLTNLWEHQITAEQDEMQDTARPSAEASARLFAMTDQLAEAPQNAAVLAAIGAQYGTYVYLMDAFRDYPEDMIRNDYNPLRRFGEQTGNIFTLSQTGLIWVHTRFSHIQAAIQQQVQQLRLYHYQDVIVSLLCEPIDRTIAALARLIEREQALVFQKWQIADILKAGAFALPTASATAGSDGYEWWYLSQNNPEGRRVRANEPCGSGGYEVERTTGDCGDPCAGEKVIIREQSNPCDCDPCESKPKYKARKADPCNPCSDEYVIERKAGPCD